MRFYKKVIKEIDPEIQKKWDEYAQSKGVLKRPFAQGPACNIIITTTRINNSRRWKPTGKTI